MKRHRNDEVLASADVALRMGQFTNAEHLASGVLKSDKGNLVAATILARALIALQRTSEAIPVLERAALRNDNPSTVTLLAAALAADGRRDDALARLQRITAAGVKFPPAYREHISQLSAAGRIDDAIDVATRGVALLPDAVDLRLDLASLHMHRNDRTNARAMLLETRTLAPGRPDVLAELGRVLLLDGDYAAAAEAYRHALALQPGDAMVRSNLAACQLEMGQRAEGEASLRAATRGQPQMIGRAIHALTASSHGRFFLRPSAVVRFLRGE